MAPGGPTLLPQAGGRSQGEEGLNRASIDFQGSM